MEGAGLEEGLTDARLPQSRRVPGSDEPAAQRDSPRRALTERSLWSVTGVWSPTLWSTGRGSAEAPEQTPFRTIRGKFENGARTILVVVVFLVSRFPGREERSSSWVVKRY